MNHESLPKVHRHVRASSRFAFIAKGSLRASIIPGAEIFLQPDVETDEEISAAHFLDFQFSRAAPPVPPGNRHRRPTVAAHDRLQRNLDREVEMGGDQRLAPVDYFLPIRL